MPLTESTAMHDLIVGLICFDVIYVPLAMLARTHVLLGADYFWELVNNDCLNFIEWEGFQGIVYPNTLTDTGGELCSLTNLGYAGKGITTKETIRKHLLPMPGKEKRGRR